MKKNLLVRLLIMACFSGIVPASKAQNITVVPNPTIPDIFAYSGGVLSGYTGTPIALNNTLVLEYNPTSYSDTGSVMQQLAVYSGTNSLKLIPNPDAGHGVYIQSVQLIFNNKLFFIYINVSGYQQLASFDGTSITLYPNPDGGLGYIGSPRILNNTLYLAYSNAAGATQFGTFNGAGISLIPNPDISGVNQGFYFNYSTVFNNTLCSRYIASDGTKHLAILNSSHTAWTILPNPDNTSRGVYPDFPALYKNKLYFIYFSATNQYQYLQYDGTNNPTLIANPQDASINEGGISGFSLVNNDTLFFQYYNTNNVLQLGKFGGTSISLVPNPDATPYGYYNTPIVYNNNLYIFYVTVDGTHHLTEYQTASNSLKVYPNVDAGLGYWDQPIIYNNEIYFIYYNAQSLFQLGHFDGSSIKLIANPGGIYNGSNGNNGYTGFPVIWNNVLYMQFGSVPYGNAGNLAYYVAGALPVTLIDFSGQKNDNTSLLQWHITNEIKNAYFSIEHSSDGISFQAIGKVNGHGTLATEQAYEFTDNNPAKGLNYYRLKQVGYDGNYTYSKIVTVTFDEVAGTFKIFPNPAINTIKITLPSSAFNSYISVYAISGKKIMTKEISSNTSSIPLDVSKFAAGVYHVTLVQGNKLQTIKMIKE